MHGGNDDSRPGTALGSRRTSIQSSSDWSCRDSMTSSRASFAAGLSRLDRRGTVMSSVTGLSQGSHGVRASVMRAGGTAQQAGPAPSQPTAAELAAAAARRQRAEQERALTQLPGLVQRLQIAEKAVLLNLQHAKLAQYHCVQYCSPVVQQAGDHRTGNADEAMQCHRSAQQSTAAAAEVQAEGVLPQGEAASAAAAAKAADALESQPPSAPFSGGPSPLATSRQQPPGLQLLWSWHSELSEELPVSCMAFNKAAPGLLAVGYGRLEYAVSGTGLVAVWSLANPAHPLWHAATSCGVSALDWSGRSTGTLAVGFFDGSLALYDVRSGSGSGVHDSSSRGGSSAGAASSSRGGGPKPLARAPPAGASSGSGSGHAEPVWRLRFVPKAADPAGEMLVSISSDGHLLEWKHAQGLERTELLRLKRLQGAAAAPRLQGPSREPQVGRGAALQCVGRPGLGRWVGRKSRAVPHQMRLPNNVLGSSWATDGQGKGTAVFGCGAETAVHLALRCRLALRVTWAARLAARALTSAPPTRAPTWWALGGLHGVLEGPAWPVVVCCFAGANLPCPPRPKWRHSGMSLSRRWAPRRAACTVAAPRSLSSTCRATEGTWGRCTRQGRQPRNAHGLQSRGRC